MCTRFVYRGDDMITGFNFDIDLTVWDHKIVKEKDRFYIGILRPDGVRHSYHGVNRNGNVGTLLYVHGNPEGAHQNSKNCITIADLTERFIQAKISFDDTLQMVQERKIVYTPDVPSCRTAQSTENASATVEWFPYVFNSWVALSYRSSPGTMKGLVLSGASTE